MTRDQRLIAVFAALALLALGAVWVGTVRAQPPPPQTVSRDVPAGPDGRVSVQFVGDTYLGDKVQLFSDQRGQGYDWAFDAIRPLLVGDYIIANVEGPISDRTEQWNPAKKFSHSSRPAAAAAMARAGIDGVTMANNHAFDVGSEGLADTLRNLDAAGIASVGAGADLARAEQPLLLRTEFGTLGIISIGESFGFEAGEGKPGTLVLSRETVQRGAALARAAGADWVIAAAHWGDNYAPINEVQRTFAQEFADAGYDLVVGAGSHSSQPIEYVGSMPVIYGVGNFVFGTNGRFAHFGAPPFGLSVDVELTRDQTPRVLVRCLVSNNLVVNFQPRPCTAPEAQAFLPTLSPELAVQGDLGVLRCEGCFARPDEDRGP